MTRLTSRVAGLIADPLLCDAWLDADGQRFGDTLDGLDPASVLGRWPHELDIDAAVRLCATLGDAPTWQHLVDTPAVAQKLAERARLQELDQAIVEHRKHLQSVCHRPRLHLRVEEERLPVSRVRRTPVRAIADLVSHPGDWEHRSLRSIQPSRVLALQVEDEWNLYENRVAVRLVDHLLAYLTKRLEELRRIRALVDASRDYASELRDTSFRRAHRIAALWSSSLDAKTEGELNQTMAALEHALRDLQALLDAPLYRQVPRRERVALALKPTNILVNDTHYRKVAALWRVWVKRGHRRQETAAERAARRQGEGAAWDRFVFHLVVRGLSALGWSATPNAGGWELRKPGRSVVQVRIGPTGVVEVSADGALRLLPLCADVAGADASGVIRQVEALDGEAEVVVVHVGALVSGSDVDRASGWSFGGRAVLFACSPWGIDCEERMARLLNGWLCRAAALPYPARTTIRALPELPAQRWLRRDGGQLVAVLAPTEREAAELDRWRTAELQAFEDRVRRAKDSKQRIEVAPRDALAALAGFVRDATAQLAGLDLCPVCGETGVVEPRPGKRADGADATWWATCGCTSSWGLRTCACGARFRALVPHVGKVDGEVAAASLSGLDWPDKVFGRDVWAQPCATGSPGQVRCPACGRCAGGACARCAGRAVGP